MALKFVTALIAAVTPKIDPPVQKLLPWEDDPSCGKDEPQVVYQAPPVLPAPPPQGGWLKFGPKLVTPEAIPEVPKPKGLIIGAGVSNTALKIAKSSPAPTAPKVLKPIQPLIQPQPVYSTGAYSILDAIQEKANGRKGTLMLVALKSGVGYKVEGYDFQTGKTKLVGANGMAFSPIIKEREAVQYKPIWR